MLPDSESDGKGTNKTHDAEFYLADEECSLLLKNFMARTYTIVVLVYRLSAP